MATQDIIQNLISRLGQSQDERRAAELAADFAQVDERTRADWLRFIQRLADRVNYHTLNAQGQVAVQGTWKNFFNHDEAALQELLAAADGTTQPHLALLLAFLELYQQPQSVLNRFTGRHLDFFYQEVLQLKRRPPLPDHAHVLLELKKNSTPVAIMPGRDLFTAGKDATGVELLYAPVFETVVSTARVASLRSLFVDPAGPGTVRYAPIANSADGVGGELQGDEPKWPAFGHAGLPAAEVGFALASPVLRMAEGTRKILVRLALGSVPAGQLTPAKLANAFEVFVTGEKSWAGPYAIAPVLAAGDVLTFDFTVPETEQAIVDYDAQIHGYQCAASAPVLQVHLKPEQPGVGYEDFAGIILQSAAVAVEVSGVTSLRLENDGGTLDPKKAFLPFGPQPTRGARFLVGCDEALSKRLSEITLRVEWKDVPAANLGTHYSSYGVSVSNASFTAGVSFQDGSGWNFAQSDRQLFNDDNATTEREFTFSRTGAPTAAPAPVSQGTKVYALSSAGSHWASLTATKFLRHQPVFTAFQSSLPEARRGFLTFALERDFLHTRYRQEYVRNVMTYSRDGGTLTILNEPYTPAIQRITLAYKAQSAEVKITGGTLDDFAHPDVQFFHLAYFGQMREHGFQRGQFAFLGDPSVTLLPAYPHRGELLIGFENLKARDSVSVLFQVADGSADPDLEPEDLEWSVLCDNYWKPLGPADLVRDTTHQLLTSGVIQFVIPAEATTTNTVQPAGHLWLKAGVAGNVMAVCQLISVAANAVVVRFQEQATNPGRLTQALPAGKITKLKSALAGVKSVSQPYSSFGGRTEESVPAFNIRVAERLRHKNRCLSAWDYERIVLEAFPQVHRVKCIPHAREGSWLAPGHVLLVVVPDLHNKNAVDPLQPKVDAGTLRRITAWVRERAGMQVQVKVRNPRYQAIQADFAVRFHPGREFNYHSQELNRALIRFLSPWAFTAGRDIAFGGRVHKSVLLDFVEELPYVDYVTDFKMYTHAAAGGAFNDVNVAEPETPDTILVSESFHRVKEVP